MTKFLTLIAFVFPVFAMATSYDDCMGKLEKTPESQQADSNKAVDKDVCSCIKSSPKADSTETDDAELMSDFLNCEDAKKVETEGIDPVPAMEDVKPAEEPKAAADAKPSDVKELLPAQY